MTNKKLLFALDQGLETKKSITKITPTERALSIAQSVANKLETPMDKESTRSLAFGLLERYYNDVLRVINIDLSSSLFRHYVNDELAYLDARDHLNPIIFFDQILDGWLFSIFQIVSIRAFHILSNDEKEDTNEILNLILQNFNSRDLHVKVPERILPYMDKYPQAILAAHCLTMTSSAFTICHEIAHHQLKHSGSTQSHAQEYQADQRGYEYLLDLSCSNHLMQDLQIRPNFLCSPALLMRVFNMVECYFAKHFGASMEGSNSHPPSDMRRRALESNNRETWDKEASNLYKGINDTIDELMNDLSL